MQYRSYRPNANDSTWNNKYRPVLERTAAIFESKSKKPVDGTALIMKVLEKWDQGTRARQISRQCLSAFLNWAVGANHLKPCYLPPTTFPETRKPKRIGFALSDIQIIELLDAIPNKKWRFAIQILSVYGLRPEELRYLVVQDGKLKTTYQKSKGGTKGERTSIRFLFPLFAALSDSDWVFFTRSNASFSPTFLLMTRSWTSSIKLWIFPWLVLSHLKGRYL